MRPFICIFLFCKSIFSFYFWIFTFEFFSTQTGIWHQQKYGKSFLIFLRVSNTRSFLQHLLDHVHRGLGLRKPRSRLHHRHRSAGQRSSSLPPAWNWGFACLLIPRNCVLKLAIKNRSAPEEPIRPHSAPGSWRNADGGHRSARCVRPVGRSVLLAKRS